MTAIATDTYELYGRSFQVGKFSCIREANRFMEANSEYGVLAVDDGVIFLALINDKGTPITPEGQRKAADKTARGPKAVNVLKLTAQLESVEKKLSKIKSRDAALEDLSRHFHLGRVGGSGRNTAALNRLRERNLEATIDAAKETIRLTARRNYLRARIAAA